MEVEVIAAVAVYLEHLTALRRAEWAFIECARTYAQLIGIDEKAWIEFGVDPWVLAAAGIGPGAEIELELEECDDHAPVPLLRLVGASDWAYLGVTGLVT